MKTFLIKNQLFYHSIFHPMNTNMFSIIDNNRALVIDPHYSDDLKSIFKSKQINDITIILTHEHPDHTSGVPWLTKNFNTTLICHKNCATSIAKETNNRPLLIYLILSEEDRRNKTNHANELKNRFVPYRCIADIIFEDYLDYNWQGHYLEFIATPGHSSGSCCVKLDKLFIFTGDTLLYNTKTITRFPGGNSEDFKNITLPFLQSLNKNIYILPGHGIVFKLSEL